MNMTAQTRISWIDMAKGYGTILVILAHIGSGIGRLWIYTFHMPLFFFLSGYVFSIKYPLGTFLKKKCKTMLIPYFCLGIPMVLYETFVTYSYSNQKWNTFIELIKNLLLQKRLWTLWYLACLFFLNILFYLLVKLCKKKWTLGLLSVIFPVLGLCYYKAGGGYLPWNIDVCLMAAPFFYTGYFMKENCEKIDAFLNVRWKKIVLFTGMLLINIICGALSIDNTWNGLEMFYSKYGANPLFTYLSAFAGIACIVIISKSISFSPIQYIGENTMLYYAWHQTIMMPVTANLLHMLGITKLLSSGSFGYQLLWLFSILLITTLLIKLFQKLHLQFILGK